MRRSLSTLFLTSLLALSLGCDGTETDVPASVGGANPDYAGRFVGEWGEENPEASFSLAVFMAPEQGRMVGTGSITRRLVVGAGFEESSFPLTVNGRVAEGEAEPTVEINVQLPTGAQVVVRGTGREGANRIEGTLSGATPFGVHDVEEFALVREL